MVFKCARNFLILLNGIFIMVGISLAASGAYLLTIVGKYGNIPGAPATTAVHATIGLGITVCLLGCLGLKGADLRKVQGSEARGVCYLTLYAAILFVIILTEIVVGVVVWTWVGNSLGPMQEKVDGNKRAAGASVKSAQQADNFMNCVFNECCPTQNINMSQFQLEECSVNKKGMPDYRGNIDDSASNCTTAPCEASENIVFICDKLEEEGALTVEACHGGIQVFRKNVAALISENLMPIAYVCVGVGGLQLLLFILAIMNICYCCGQSEPKVQDDYDDEEEYGY